MSERRTTVSTALRPGRNDPCPCGSGRKFKFCCGAGSSQSETAARRTPLTPPSEGSPASGISGFGPLTEVSDLHATAEEFWRRQSVQVVAPGFPDRVPGADAPVPAHRAMAAERHRQRGARLIEAGRPAAAIAAFTRATRFDPRDAAAYRSLGQALLDSGRAAEAVDSLRLATALEDDAAAFHNLATALRRLRFNVEAIAAYRRAAELAPSLVEAHIGLADLLEQAGEDEEAAQSLRAAAVIAPDTSVGRLCSGRAAMLERDFAGAEAELRRGTELDPQDDAMVKNLGDVLARLGRFSEAIAAFDRAIALNPWQFTAHFAAVEAQKCTEADRPRLAQIRASLGEPWLDEDDCVLLHFAAGKLLDDLGEYAEAMQHYEAGNQVRGRQTAFDRAGFTADVDRLLRRYTREFFAANRAFATDDETPLLIVGLPRSGTTLVEQILSRHPQIGAGGEQAFWIRRAAASGTLESTYLTPEIGHGLAQQYLSLLRRIAPSSPRVTDKLPFNLLCLGVIHLLLPNARVIQCRRHPVDTCLSIYFTRFTQSLSFVGDKGDLAVAYRQYARLMDHWRQVLPPERLLEVDYERLVADPEAVTRQLIAFTGLAWDDRCLRPEHNPLPVMTASLWQARQPVYATSVERWRRYEPWLGELRQLLDRQEGDDGVGG